MSHIVAFIQHMKLQFEDSESIRQPVQDCHVSTWVTLHYSVCNNYINTGQMQDFTTQMKTNIVNDCAKWQLTVNRQLSCGNGVIMVLNNSIS